MKLCRFIGPLVFYSLNIKAMTHGFMVTAKPIMIEEKRLCPEEDIEDSIINLKVENEIIVENTKIAYAKITANWFSNPAKDLAAITSGTAIAPESISKSLPTVVQVLPNACNCA